MNDVIIVAQSLTKIYDQMTDYPVKSLDHVSLEVKDGEFIAIMGPSGSGKTTLITKLIPKFTSLGYKVATIKHDGHDFDADVEGTDSYKHKQAGAYGTAVFSKNKFMVVKEQKETVKVEKKAEKVAEVEELSAKATVKYARISSRKVAIVANLIRGKNVDEALAILKFTPKAGSEVLEKLLKSAIANAENNHHMAHEKLYVAEIYANQGPTLKRIRPAAKGSAVRIRKRTSHITIVLKELN